jgi:transposase
MARQIISDELWCFVEPHLPVRRPHPKGGRPTVRDRDVLTGIVFVLKTGISWEDLPDEMGCGCGMTCFRRLRSWHQCGVWQRIQPILESRLQHSDRVDWDRANLDVQRKRGAPKQGGRGDGSDNVHVTHGAPESSQEQEGPMAAACWQPAR